MKYKRYRAECKSCGAVEKYENHPRWLHPHFLSAHCWKCDKAMDDWSWVISYGYHVSDKEKINWYNPFTWSAKKWKEISK